MSVNHCSRTYWTPAMERYFINLMLEHIHRGNRTGYTFNKQAWTDMLGVFNAKFGSQYDKDVLKSRYTNLWKVFNDIKNILSQNGFSWDETRQMVVADDCVGSIYQEARPYRTKPVHNFDDLCLIYGYTVADGRYSRSSHDVDVEDGMYFGNCSSSVAPSCCSRTEWTTDMDQYFIELMLKQQENGNKLDSTFTKQAWTDMLTLFNAKFSSEYNKRVLRHRYKKLTKYHNDIMTLIKQEGFCWDEKQEMAVADDDVWDAYIKAHPQARSYRGKVFPSYNNLSLIFGDVIGKETQSASHQDKDIKSEVVVPKAGSERSRTYWTPPMDRFLIDLMLEQVRAGNRIGQSFITRAWNDMVQSFNANFNSHHDREVLKNRYKHFRKQYNDVRVLLEHSGFSWDEGREMVTAEDHVWDAHIKANPDSRSYRVKTVPCYHKLCVIYGQDTCNGSNSHLLGRTNPTTETCAKIGSDPIIEWTEPMERYFIELLLEQVDHGNKIDDAFSEQAWANMTLSFKEKFGPQYEQHILESHCLILMKQYIVISNLLTQQGFLWDEALQMIIADEDTWESYIKEHPEAVSYKDKVSESYSKLCNIFGTTELIYRKLSCNVEMELDQHPIDIKIDECCGDLPVTFLETEKYNQVKKRPPGMTLEGHAKEQKTDKKSVKGDIADDRSVFTKMVNEETGNSNYVAIERAVGALQAIADMDDELLLDGCDLLEDESKAKTFLALDATLRKKWLLRKLGRA